jgi:hypothetical protein
MKTHKELELQMFRVAPTATKGQSLIQWDIDENGLPRRSIQVDTEIAKLWAESGMLYGLAKSLIGKHGFKGLNDLNYNFGRRVIEKLERKG